MSTISIGIQSDSVVKPSVLRVGSNAFGGRVGYILKPGDPGFVVGQIKGFVVANPPNIGPNFGTTFWAPSATLTSATGTAIGTGLSNTNDIFSAFGTGSTYAARVCRDYNGGGFNDWYLPSKDELVALSQNASILDLSANPFYYSSSQITDSTVWVVYPSGTTQSFSFSGSSYMVTAIRNFTV